MFQSILTLILVSSSIFLSDTPNDVPQHYADFVSGRFSYHSHTFSLQIHVGRLFQNYSGPIYIFINSDGDENTGWNNTGYISEDEFRLWGADLMVVVNHRYPNNSALYTLNSDGSRVFLSTIPCSIVRTTETLSRIVLVLNNLPGDTITVKLFMNEEGNWGDIFPDNHPIILINDTQLSNLYRD